MKEVGLGCGQPAFLTIFAAQRRLDQSRDRERLSEYFQKNGLIDEKSKVMNGAILVTFDFALKALRF